MIGWIIFATYITVWLLSIYPTYKMAAESMARPRYGSGVDISGDDIAMSMLIGTMATLLWPVLLPFVVSWTLHNRRSPRRIRNEKERIETDVSHKIDFEKRLKQASIEVRSAEEDHVDKMLREWKKSH